MKCPDCGRECIEDSNYCFYCGHSFRELSLMEKRIPEDDTVYVEREPDRPVGADDNKPMSRLWWMAYFALLMTPALYPILFIVTCVWAFGSKGSAERKNFARALLTFLIVVFLIAIITAIYYISAYGMDEAINKLTNGLATNSDALMKMYYGDTLNN